MNRWAGRLHASGSRQARAPIPGPRSQGPSVRFKTADRKALLLGTALASTLLVASLAAPTEAQAASSCTVGGVNFVLPDPPDPIDIVNTPPGNIVCENDVMRTGDGTSGFAAINLETDDDAEPIVLDTDGPLDSYNFAGNAYGIRTVTDGLGSTITITNDGGIDVETGGDNAGAYGISATTAGENSRVEIVNHGDIEVDTNGGFSNAYGIRVGRAGGFGINSPIIIHNSGDIRVETQGGGSNVDGIHAITQGDNNSVTIHNSGHIDVTARGAGVVDGIYVATVGINADAKVYNSGDIRVLTEGVGPPPDAFNVGTRRPDSSIEVHNSGDVWMLSTGLANNTDGFDLTATRANSPITVANSGDVHIRTTGGSASAAGFSVVTYGAAADSRIAIHNSGDFRVETDAEDAEAQVISASARAPRSRINIWNSGDLHVKTRGAESEAYGIDAETRREHSPIAIHNSGDIHAEAKGASVVKGIDVETHGVNSPIHVENSGSVFAAGRLSTGIFTSSVVANPTTIENTGDISAESYRAIDVKGAGTAHIYNAGRITGFVDLTEQRDRFFNQAGGVFETKLTSLFGGGDDFFFNQVGGTVQAATDSSVAERSSFVGLETFHNRGLISLVDGKAGDLFAISNTLGGTDLSFVGGSGSTLALDVFLDGPASPADTFTIQGDVSGTTTVVINNTNFAPGTFNPTGIPVIFVEGATPSESNFQLAQPVDTGFFDYDLFFVPSNSGFWELRSFTGAGAFLLPQLVTAAQDIWHQGSNTWFDRTADLRVLLAGGAAPTAYDPDGKSLEAVGPYPLTPAVWARGSGGWLDRDDSAKTRAYGRNYTFDLDRELTTLDFQVGVDLGQRDVMNDGDALVFGMLGGFVYGGLDYDAIPRSFDFSGGQVGAYATYLNGGLFVDTLLNVHLYELSTATRGFPSSLDANTVGLRTDTGYRFGSFTGGAFLEPLATIEVLWADIDGFSLGGNRVSFDDDANVRGRLGLRAGTTMQAWEGTLMEPFVIGSVWGNLSEDNSATLVSNGRTFSFQDDLEDVWGEISAGLNVFNFSQTTAVFAKVDVAIGDDISGVGGKAGMRVNW